MALSSILGREFYLLQRLPSTGAVHQCITDPEGDSEAFLSLFAPILGALASSESPAAHPLASLHRALGAALIRSKESSPYQRTPLQLTDPALALRAPRP